MSADREIDDRHILDARGAKADVDWRVPYTFFAESEVSVAGIAEDVATIFLTNRECPFRCLFCDLWKNTTDERVPVGAIPGQIEHALARLPAAHHVKLYNSGNFFDVQAIPPADHAAIAERVAQFQTVIVENHPKLCGSACFIFRDLLREAAKRQATGHDRSAGCGVPHQHERAPQLEIALGLETVHPDILPRLNKQMTLDDFQRATAFLSSHEIATRAFILLKPPFMPEEKCVDWAVRSIEFAFDCGVRVCSVIPTRSGNGILDLIARDGDFSPPRPASLEDALARGIALGRGRVFVDLWDAVRFFNCPACGPARMARLREMNLSQTILPAVECACDVETAI